MKPYILFRKDRYNCEEFAIAKNYLPCIESRSKCPSDSVVIGRYSVLPYYAELEDDLRHVGSSLINSYDQHRWIASFEYYDVLKDYTPESWRGGREFAFCDYEGPFVVKGETNSKKHKWKTHMFAKDRRDAVEVACRLLDDSHYENQEIIYRKFIPLKTFEINPTGLPITNEWRFFYLGTKRLAYGYYWSIAENVSLGKISQDGLDFADKIAKIASEHCNFFVIDIAEKSDGDWIMIELNDGQMSGLSEVNPEMLYSNLAKELSDYTYFIPDFYDNPSERL